jgi:hypothetical protein
MRALSLNSHCVAIGKVLKTRRIRGFFMFVSFEADFFFKYPDYTRIAAFNMARISLTTLFSCRLTLRRRVVFFKVSH